MKALLLDTHVLLWWLMKPRKLARKVHALIEREDVSVGVSVISIWEMRLKQQHGKLTLPPGSLSSLVEAQDFRVLPLRVEHVNAAADTGGMHGDPYDRLLVGTARAERMVFVTRDAGILESAAPALGELLLEA
jgi:PIN domain nuclease of toxin-antitoxin system